MSEFQEGYQPTPWVDVGGERIYGTRVRDLEPDDLEKLKLTPDALLHVTRHLVTLFPEARAQLLGLQRTDENGATHPIDDGFVAAQLAAAGSKFHPSVQDPEKVIAWAMEQFAQALREGKKLPWVESLATGERSVSMTVTATADDKRFLGIPPGESMGNGSVIPVTPELAPRVVQEQRGKGEAKDRIVVNVITGMDAPPTDQTILVLKQVKATGQYEFYTAYTGVNSPKLPRPGEQQPDELAYNQAWWDRHTFVKP